MVTAIVTATVRGYGCGDSYSNGYDDRYKTGGKRCLSRLIAGKDSNYNDGYRNGCTDLYNGSGAV